jgi:hypothetical protein
MGQIVIAKCDNCGFKQEFTFGAGWADHMTNCSVPAIDQQTGAFVVQNYFEKSTFNGRFRFYNEPGMFEGELKWPFLESGDVALSQTANLCPHCEQFKLRFNIIIWFD